MTVLLDLWVSQIEILILHHSSISPLKIFGVKDIDLFMEFIYYKIKTQ